MNYSAIKYYDIANGPGVRTVLFVSGCRNHCEGCFQPETWSFENGQTFDNAAREAILKSLEPDYISGLTLLGGDPFEPENQAALLPFVKEVREKYPFKTIWAFTGYVLEKDLVPGGLKHTEATDELLCLIDVLVDGPFILSRKNISLRFRGSDNQRLIDMDKYRATGEITESES